MLTEKIVLMSALVATTLAVECLYNGASIPGERKSMSCEHGCCEQECCDGLNWWMILAFILVGIFLTFVIVIAIYLIVKQKNKKKERVGNTTNSQVSRDQPSTVDLSVFRTENSRTSHPPPYSIIDRCHHEHTANRRPNLIDHYVHDRYQENADNTASWENADFSYLEQSDFERRAHRAEDFVGDGYHLHNDDNPASWRNSDFSYFDMYLERSKNSDNERWNSPIEYSENITFSKPSAEFEEPLPYDHPDLTADSRYLGSTMVQSSESPTVELYRNSRFHCMASNS